MNLNKKFLYADSSSKKRTQNRRNENRKNDSKNTGMIEIWEDVVSLKELILSLTLCLFTSFSGYYLAPVKEPWPLLFGLLGAILGFIISSIVIRPKRILIQESEE